MNRNYFLTNAFLIIIFSFPILHLSFKDKNFSQIENRPLESFPKLTKNDFLSGEFSKNLNSYLEDHFPFRNNFISLKSSFEILMGRTDINEIYLGDNNYLIEMFDKIDFETTKRNVKLINDFSQDKNVALMLIPTSTEILKEYLPKFSLRVDQKEYLNYIGNSLNENIKFINPIYALNSNKNKYIYYRTDHHYTTLGAYYSYLKFCEEFNITPYLLEDFNIKEVSTNFLGSLFSKVIIPYQERDVVNIFEPKKENKLKVYYSNGKVSNSLYEFSHLNNPRNIYNIFLDNNHPTIKITTSINNNKKICVIKDSYANSFIPFLSNHFEEIHVIDLRFYSSNITNYLKENDLKDILFYYNVKNFSEDNYLIFIENKGD